jgi:hypothetical protein
MKIPYNRTRTFSTSELPGVYCEPPLKFEIIANPSFDLMTDISNWIKNPTWEETRRLAAIFLVAVITQDDRYELGTIKSIQELADQTEEIFIASLINGWNTRISLERITELKKSNPTFMQLEETEKGKNQAEQYQ